MDTFDLHLTLANDAMRTRADVAEALRGLADELDSSQGYVDDADGRPILDANGNTVGSWSIGLDMRDVLGNALFSVVLGMKAAWIEWKRGRGADAAMIWIENTLEGGDSLPPADATDAQLFFDLGHSRRRDVNRARQ